MIVHTLNHSSMRRNITVVPQAIIGMVLQVRAAMNLAELRRHDAPAALRLHRAQRGHRVGVSVAETRAMWHLIEPIWRNDRTDPHRLEKQLVAWVARRHWPGHSLLASPKAPLIYSQRCIISLDRLTQLGRNCQ